MLKLTGTIKVASLSLLLVPFKAAWLSWHCYYLLDKNNSNFNFLVKIQVSFDWFDNLLNVPKHKFPHHAGASGRSMHQTEETRRPFTNYEGE